MKVLRSFLKACLNEKVLGQSIGIFFNKRTNIAPEAQINEYIVEKILRHRVAQGGEVQFLTY